MMPLSMVVMPFLSSFHNVNNLVLLSPMYMPNVSYMKSKALYANMDPEIFNSFLYHALKPQSDVSGTAEHTVRFISVCIYTNACLCCADSSIIVYEMLFN